MSDGLNLVGGEGLPDGDDDEPGPHAVEREEGVEEDLQDVVGGEAGHVEQGLERDGAQDPTGEEHQPEKGVLFSTRIYELPFKK